MSKPNLDSETRTRSYVVELHEGQHRLATSEDFEEQAALKRTSPGGADSMKEERIWDAIRVTAQNPLRRRLESRNCRNHEILEQVHALRRGA
jgi:hypothetical protein